MEELLNQIITAAIGVGLLGGVYLLDLFVGIIKVMFTDGLTWSWKKMLKGLLKAILISVSIVALVAILNAVEWYGAQVGADLSFIGDCSYPSIILGIVGGIGYYLTSAFKNVLDFIKKKSGATIDEEKLAEGTKELGESVANWLGQFRATDENGEAEKVANEGAEEIEVGQGTVNPIDRILPDGDNDNGKGWQCSKYSWFLATGIKMNYAPRPDYGPCNGRDMVDYLVKNRGFVRCGKERGAIFSTQDGTYGHTGIVLDPATNKINNANWNPLVVSTNSGYSKLNASTTKFCKPAGYNGDTGTVIPAAEKKSNEEIANEVIQGKWGNGADRKKRLENAGYNYNEIQAIVNQKLAPTNTAPTTSNGVKIGDRVTTTSQTDQNGVYLNLRIINDGKSIYAENNSRGMAVLRTPNGTVRCAVPVGSLRKA